MSSPGVLAMAGSGAGPELDPDEDPGWVRVVSGAEVWDEPWEVEAGVDAGAEQAPKVRPVRPAAMTVRREKPPFSSSGRSSGTGTTHRATIGALP
jgi:hypothetical protein